jgi:YidC/Oxa1 family membrane protein insertase
MHGSFLAFARAASCAEEGGGKPPHSKGRAVSGQRKELPYEARIVIAFLLSVVVMAVWSYFYRPTPPPAEAPAPISAPAPSSTPASTPPAAPGTTGAATSTQPSAGTSKPTQVSAAPPAAAIPAAQAAQEQTIVVENGNYRVELSNRGAVVRSWQLLNYKDSSKEHKTLDVVNAETAQALGGWPLAVAVNDGGLNQKLNDVLYEVTPAAGPVKAPAEVVFRWSDGTTVATKRLRFDDESYVVEIASSVEQNGQPVAHSLTWRGGFGDRAAYMHADSTFVVYRSAGVLHQLAYGKLGQPEGRENWFQQPEAMDYAGVADRYFAAVFLPDGAAGSGGPAMGPGLTLWHSKRDHKTTVDKKETTVPVPEVAVGLQAVIGAVQTRLFVGPKDTEVLARQNPPMTDLVDYGWDWLEPIARLLFAFLKWIHSYVPNWGWAIVLMTIAINTLLFPLKVKSWRSMQKMQKLMPEMQQIKQRYAKYKMTDPRKQQEQQEMMAVYKKHGVNPLGAGGCLPMVLQMPIWFALYQMLGASIELRHAPWMFWIRDLASPDPYFILPVFMAASMYASQKMTPVTTPDPAQARMMNMMPLIFGGMFVFFPVSSGLVLYILTSMLVGMAQQWYLNKSNPLKKKSRAEK